MSITGPQFEQLQNVLVSAFDDAGLEQLCAFELEVDFGSITAPGSRTERVFQLIGWAKRTERIGDLLAGAYNRNPTNSAVQALVQEAQNWPVGWAAGLTVLDGQASVFASRQQELAYLNAILTDYEAWAQRYTPLAGIAEVPVAGARRPRLLAPDSFMPPEFALLSREGQTAMSSAERQPVNDLRQAVRQYRRLVVLGEPGSGKTTTLQMLRREYALAAKQDPTAPLPVLVALGGYNGDETALDYVMRRAGSLGGHLPAYLHSRRCILLLDGLNEMPQRDYSERVRRIQSLFDRFPTVPAVATCRALDYIEPLKLQKLEIKPLDVNRRREYLHRYLGETDGDALFWRLAGGEDIAALWRTWAEAGGSWEDFWQAEKMPEAVYTKTTAAQDAVWVRLHAVKLSSLLELSANPYLLAILIDLYDKGEGQLPQNRARLFGDFAAVLFAREKTRRRSGAFWPGDEVLQSALAQLAYAMQSAGERGTAVEHGWAETQLAAAECAPAALLTAAAGATLLDLSGGQVRFVHQLIQEYFAALAWQSQFAAGDDLRRYWPDGWTTPSGWEETAVLLAGLLPDMTAFITQLLPANPPLAARCVAESGGVRPGVEVISGVQSALVEIASSLTALGKERVVAGDALNYLGDPRPGVGVKDDVPDIVWCTVPAGPFLMGNTGETDSMAYEWEMPQQSVNLLAFAVSKYLITNAQYQAFVHDGAYTEHWRNCWTAAGWQWKEQNSIEGPRRIGGDFNLANHPVVGVSWYEAVAFCRWLTKKLGRSTMLPTEAQWEKAARGKDGRLFPWGPEITPEHANYEDTGIGSSSAVGIFPKGESPCHVLDAAGNVWEWTITEWTQNYQQYKSDDDLEGDAPRMFRGGPWDNAAEYLRCASRGYGDPNFRGHHIGFRIVSPGS